jgi:hypothetical protein
MPYDIWNLYEGDEHSYEEDQLHQWPSHSTEMQKLSENMIFFNTR